MRHLVAGAVGLLMSIAATGVAQSQSAVVVELYTSQGCSSCPPADDYLASIAARDDVIALALHVDYWDYIGWKDVFGDPAFTARQHAYAQAANARSVYTPQFIVGGTDTVSGNGPAEVAALIRDHMGRTQPVNLSVQRSGDSVQITADAAKPLPRGAVVQVLRYRPEASVNIKRGELAGRTISYNNIVTRIDVLGSWNGQGTYRASTQAGQGPLVVIVQASGMGPILAAARLK